MSTNQPRRRSKTGLVVAVVVLVVLLAVGFIFGKRYYDARSNRQPGLRRHH